MSPRTIFGVAARTKEYALLQERMEKSGRNPSNGFDNDFIDDMIEVFKPFLKPVAPPEKPKRRRK